MSFLPILPVLCFQGGVGGVGEGFNVFQRKWARSKWISLWAALSCPMCSVGNKVTEGDPSHISRRGAGRQHVRINWDKMGLSKAHDVFIYLFLHSESPECRMSKLQQARSLMPSVTEWGIKGKVLKGLSGRGGRTPVACPPAFVGHTHEFSQ